MLRRNGLLVAAVSALTAQISQANIDPGSYVLSNLPGRGGASYGLRLNDLFDVAPGKVDAFTFDFNAPGSSMVLDFDGTNIRIHGVSFGGLQSGTRTNLGMSGYWNIDFTYSSVTTVPGDDDLGVFSGGKPNQGTISYITDSSVNPNQVGAFAHSGSITLFDHATASPFTFRLGDEDNDAGRNGNNAVSGWGWLNHHSTAQVTSSNWSFALNPVPVPGAALLAGLGLLGVALVRAGRG